MAGNGRLAGKVVVITGGSSGIGKATACLCAAEGANLALVAHQAERLQAAIAEITPLLTGGQARPFCCDISDMAQVARMADLVHAEFGQVDVLVNNAGYTVYKTFAELSLEEIDHITRVNYLGPLYCSKVFLDGMAARGVGHVVNVTSVGARLPITPSSVYNGAKHGMAGMTEMLDYEYDCLGIRFSEFLPGRVDTPFFDHETFRRRPERPENRGILPVGVVAQALLEMILGGQRSRVIPRRFAVAIWLNATMPMIFRPLMRWIIRRRVIDHYEQVGWPVPRRAPGR